MLKKISIISILLFVFSCSSIGYHNKEGPTIYISNVSTKKITNIKLNWAGNNLSLSAIERGNTKGQSFYVKKDEDFFGTVEISWYDSEGEKKFRDFFFNPIHLPSFTDKTIYSYIQIYLDQEELEIVTSDAPDLAGKLAKMDRLLRGLKRHKDGDDISLITVEPKDSRAISRNLESMSPY